MFFFVHLFLMFWTEEGQGRAPPAWMEEEVHPRFELFLFDFTGSSQTSTKKLPVCRPAGPAPDLPPRCQLPLCGGGGCHIQRQQKAAAGPAGVTS